MLPTMAKLTVYLPEDVDRRLLPFRGALNLSEIAKTAIEERLRMEEAAVGNVRDQVLNRLRQADAVQNAVRTRGEDAGRAWAKDVATLADMKNVASWPTVTFPHQVVSANATGTLGAMALVELAVVVASKGKAGPMGQCVLPSSAQVQPPPGMKPQKVVEFWNGFAAGVREVYELVKDAF